MKQFKYIGIMFNGDNVSTCDGKILITQGKRFCGRI